MDIPGATFSIQHEWYKRVRSWHNYNASVLEIGCAYGRSTWAWLDVLDGNQDEIEIVDTLSYTPTNNNFLEHPNAKSIITDVGGYDQEKIFRYNVEQHRNYEKITKFYNTTSENFCNNVKNKIYDIVYLDGAHEYETVIHELNCFKDARVICGDDFSYDGLGVVSAVFDFYKNNINDYNLYVDSEARFFALRKLH